MAASAVWRTVLDPVRQAPKSERHVKSVIGRILPDRDIFRSRAMHASILASQPILKASALPPLEVDAAINSLDALLDSTLCSWRRVIREELLHIVAHLR